MAIGPFVNAVIALDMATNTVYDLDRNSGRKAVANLLMMENLNEDYIDDDGVFFEAMDVYADTWINNIKDGLDMYVIDSSKARMLAELASERQHTEGR